MTFPPWVEALVAEGYCSRACATFVFAIRESRRVPCTLDEVGRAMAVEGFSELEVLAACTEALTLRAVRTDQSEFRPGMSAFYWVETSWRA